MTRALVLTVRLAALTVVLFICFAVAGTIVELPGSGEPEAQAGEAAVRLLAVCFLIVAVLTHIILRSRGAGWKLVLTVFLVYYGVATFMGQIESAVFLTRLPPGAVRMAHLLETASSNFLFGALVGWLMGAPRRPDASSI